MNALLAALKQQGSAALRADIENEEQTVHISSWVGMPMNQALTRFHESVASTTTIPVAASLHGANGSFFHSDLEVFNRSATETVTVLSSTELLSSGPATIDDAL